MIYVPTTLPTNCTLSFHFLGMSHCVGTVSRQGIRADNDGEAVANLRKAGAIPIAVTNTPELCASIETHNKLTGYTPNPYDLTRTSGGSSGGEVLATMRRWNFHFRICVKFKYLNSTLSFARYMYIAGRFDCFWSIRSWNRIRFSRLYSCTVFIHRNFRTQTNTR